MLTLDGCVSGPNGELDWLFEINDDGRNKFFFDLYNSIDGAIFGRITYQAMANHWTSAEWNTSSDKNDVFARIMNNLNKYVFSRTLEKVEWANSTLIKGDVTEAVTKLKHQSGKNIVLCGGIGIVKTFMKLNLIDEYRLIVHPIAIGKGIHLFEDLNDKMNLKLLNTINFPTGITALYYEKSD
jgi:dihydrofolate reductase